MLGDTLVFSACICIMQYSPFYRYSILNGLWRVQIIISLPMWVLSSRFIVFISHNVWTMKFTTRLTHHLILITCYYLLTKNEISLQCSNLDCFACEHRYIEIANVCKLLKIYSVLPLKLLIRNESFIWIRSVFSLLHIQWDCSYEWALNQLLQI